MGKLTKAQLDALNWLWRDGSKRTWGGKDCGHPAISSLESLVRNGLAIKRGGGGWPAEYGITDAGRAAISAEVGEQTDV